MSDERYYPEAHEKIVVTLVLALSELLEDPVVQSDAKAHGVVKAIFEAIGNSGAEVLDDPTAIPAYMAGAMAKLRANVDARRAIWEKLLAEYRASPYKRGDRDRFIKRAVIETGYSEPTIKRFLRVK